MLSSKRAGLLSAVLILGPQLTQPRLLSLRDRGLGDQTAENELAGRVEPVAGQRIDDLTPYALLDGIQVRRWLRTAPPRGGAVRSHRRTWIPSSSAYGVKSSMRCPATGSTLPASSFSAVWSPRPRSRSDKRRGCVSCGPRIKTAERRPARLLLSMVCWPRTLPTFLLSCVLHLAHSCGLGQLAQR